MSSVSNNVILTNDGKKYEKATLAKTTCAVLSANFANNAVKKTGANISSALMKNLLDSKINPADFKEYAKKAFENSGLKEKGVKFIQAGNKNEKEIAEMAEKELPKFLDKIPFVKNFVKNLTIGNMFLANEGMNAFYYAKGKNIFVNMDSKMAFSAFHEMGHGLMYNKKALGSILRGSRMLQPVIATATLLCTLLKREKVEGEEPKNAFDKATTFVKNNCAKITLLSYAPLLFDEALASIKGYNLAQATGLAKDKLKQLAKLQGKAFSTYAMLAMGATLGVKIASLVRDKITKPKEIEENPIDKKAS